MRARYHQLPKYFNNSNWSSLQLFDWATLDMAHQPRFKYPKSFLLPSPVLTKSINKTGTPAQETPTEQLKWYAKPSTSPPSLLTVCRQFALSRGNLQTPWIFVSKKQIDHFTSLAQISLIFEHTPDRIVDLDWRVKCPAFHVPKHDEFSPLNTDVQSKTPFVPEIVIEFEWKPHGKGENVELGMAFLLAGAFIVVCILVGLTLVDLIQNTGSMSITSMGGSSDKYG